METVGGCFRDPRELSRIWLQWTPSPVAAIGNPSMGESTSFRLYAPACCRSECRARVALRHLLEKPSPQTIRTSRTRILNLPVSPGEDAGVWPRRCPLPLRSDDRVPPPFLVLSLRFLVLSPGASKNRAMYPAFPPPPLVLGRIEWGKLIQEEGRSSGRRSCAPSFSPPFLLLFGCSGVVGRLFFILVGRPPQNEPTVDPTFLVCWSVLPPLAPLYKRA